MKAWTFRLSLGLLLVAFVSCGPEFIDQNYRLKITTESKVRSGPGPEYSVVATAKAGTEVMLLESDNDWHKIRMLDGRSGWIFRGITKTIGPEKIVMLNDARIRRGPGEEYKAFAIVVKAKTLDSRGERGNWFLVDLTDGKSGWVSKKDAEKVSYLNLTANKSTTIFQLPNPNSQVLLNVNAGTELIQLGKQGDYFMVRLPGGDTGWIHKDYTNTVQEKTLLVKDRTYVRYGPSIEYDVVETVEKGTRLTLLTQKDAWYNVRTPQGKTGWVYQDFISRTKATGYDATLPSDQPEYVVTNEDCNIRQGYGLNWEVIQRAKKGTVLVKIGQRDDWLRVKMPDQRIGWIREDLVTSNPTVLITLDQSNIRKGPSTDFLVVATVAKGTPLVKIAEESGWSQVYLPEGGTGWIRNDLNADTQSALFAKEDCNVRDGPGTNYNQIERIPMGTPVVQIEKQNDWYKVKLPSNRIGWIREDLLRETASQLVTSERANIRVGPGTEYRVLMEVEKDTPLIKLEEQGNWFRVKLPDGQIGWIRNDLVTFSYYPITSEAQPITNYPTTTFSAKSQLIDVKMITSSSINLRTRPDTSAERIATLPAGTKVTRINQQGEWYEVQTSEGVLGFVHQSGFITGSKLLLTNSKSNIRFGPSKDYKIIASVPEKTSVTKLDQRDDWIYVRLSNNQKGWIQKDLVDQSGGPSPPLPRVTELAYGTLITTAPCKILKGPEENYPTVKSINLNTELTKVGEYKDWYEVELRTGEKGWVSKEFVREMLNKKIIAIRKAEVHQQSTSQSGLLGIVNSGAFYPPLNEENGWYRIQFNPGTTGWIDGNDVMTLKYPPIYVKAGTADIMRFPDTKSNRIAVIKEGLELVPLDETDNWLFVELPRGDKGWIQKKLVDRQKHPRIRVAKDTDAYEQPTAGSQRKASLITGDQFLALNKDKNWYKILLRGSEIGWVYAGYVEEITKGTLLLRDESNLRMGPGFEYRIINSVPIPKGEQVKWLDEKNGWSQIQMGSEVGWVKLDMAKDVTLPEMTASRNANVHAGPGTNYAQVGEVRKDRKYTPVRKENGWYQLRLPTGSEGWVSMDVFSPKKSRLVFTLDKANIRKGPGLHYPVVAQVEPAVDVTIIGGEGEWYFVQLQDGTTKGYIQKGLVFEE